MPYYPGTDCTFRERFALEVTHPIVWTSWQYYRFKQFTDLDFYAYVKTQSIDYSNWLNGDLELGNYIAIGQYNQIFFNYFGYYSGM